jgi:hypothetical protein
MGYLKDRQKYAKRIEIKKLVVRHLIDSSQYENMRAQNIIKKVIDKRKLGRFSHSFCIGYIIGLSDGNKYLKHYCINQYIDKIKADKARDSFFAKLSEDERKEWLHGE